MDFLTCRLADPLGRNCDMVGCLVMPCKAVRVEFLGDGFSVGFLVGGLFVDFPRARFFGRCLRWICWRIFEVEFLVEFRCGF